MLHLEHSATLLQKIHFPEYIQGYTIFLNPDGSWQSRAHTPLASVYISHKAIDLTLHHSDVSASLSLPIDEAMTVEQPVHIFYRNWTYTLSRYASAPQWWPYMGKITIPPKRASYPFNTEFTIGRKEDATIRLPSDGHCENIIWHGGLTLVDMIPTPSGQISKKRFATDMINVSSHHGTFSLVKSNVLLRCESTQCPIFINRTDEVIVLSPTDKNATGVSCFIQVGDEILVGNHCYNVMRLPDKTHKQETSINDILEAEQIALGQSRHIAEHTDVAIFGKTAQTNDSNAGPVVISIAEQEWEFSLQSTYRIKILGWIMKGEQTIGNHNQCAICIPENRSTAQQRFQPTVYASAHIRHGKGHLTVQNGQEFHIHHSERPLLEQHFSLLRRSPSGHIDFKLQLKPSEDSPVPGGMLFRLDHHDETTSAMFHVALYENMTQIAQLCQHTCTTKLTDNTLRIIAPDNVRLMQQQAGKWAVNQSPYIELRPNDLAIIDTLLLQFIHEEITVIDRPHSFGLPTS